MNQFAAIKVTKAQIGRVMAFLELSPGEDDEQLKLDMIEGETELNEVVSHLLSQNEDDEGMVGVIKAQIDLKRERIGRIEKRIESRKSAIVSLMDSAFLKKLALPEATVSIRTLQSRPKVIDEAQLPDAFVIEEVVRKPDKEAIEAAVENGAIIPGVVMTNGGASLSVRRK